MAHGEGLVHGRAQDGPRLGEGLGVVNLDSCLRPYGPKLLSGRRSVDVRRDEERVMTTLRQEAAELGGGRRLARALEARHQKNRRGPGCRLEQRGLIAAQHRHEFVAHDAQDGLVGREALQDFLAQRLGADSLEKLLDDLEVDVGLEQGQTDLTEGCVHMPLRKRTLASQGPECRLESLAQSLEHAVNVSSFTLAATRDGTHPRPRTSSSARHASQGNT